MIWLYFITPWVLQTLIWVPTRLFLWFFGHLEVKGFEHIKDLPRGVIFAVNHTSELDPIVVPASLPFFCHLMPMFYTSREKQFYKFSSWRQIFYGGTFFKIWGAYPVVVGLHNYEKSLATHANIVRHGGSLMIFPEGKRSRDGKLQPAKGGVAFLAHATNKPIVPVAISGLFGLRARDYFLRKARISVIFGTPVTAQELFTTKSLAFVDGKDPCLEAAQKVMNTIGTQLPPHNIIMAPHLSPISLPNREVTARS